MSAPQGCTALNKLFIHLCLASHIGNYGETIVFGQLGYKTLETVPGMEKGQRETRLCELALGQSQAALRSRGRSDRPRWAPRKKTPSLSWDSGSPGPLRVLLGVRDRTQPGEGTWPLCSHSLFLFMLIIFNRFTKDLCFPKITPLVH